MQGWGNGEFQGISITTLLAHSGFDRISLLKLDIEGADAEVFSGDTQWLYRGDAIAIELHDDSHFGDAAELLLHAIADRGFDIMDSGEYKICRRHF